MALLPEEATWEPGIYQLEETDVVQGGPNGIDNLQAKQLANRLLYLKSLAEGKQAADPLLAALAALVTAADKLPYFTGVDTVAMTNLTAFMRTVLAAGDATAARATLGAATQADINAAIAALVASSPATLDTLNELAVALGNDPNFATTITTALGLKAPLASPALTGNPTAPTAAPGTSTTQLANTAFVQAAITALSGFASEAEAQGLAVLNKVISPGTLDAALKGANQSLVAAGGYQKLPGGLILQWGRIAHGTGSGAVAFGGNFPIAFPNAPFVIFGANLASPVDALFFTCVTLTAAGFTGTVYDYSGGAIAAGDFMYCAIGH